MSLHFLLFKYATTALNEIGHWAYAKLEHLINSQKYICFSNTVFLIQLLLNLGTVNKKQFYFIYWGSTEHGLSMYILRSLWSTPTCRQAPKHVFGDSPLPERCHQGTWTPSTSGEKILSTISKPIS